MIEQRDRSPWGELSKSGVACTGDNRVAWRLIRSNCLRFESDTSYYGAIIVMCYYVCRVFFAFPCLSDERGCPGVSARDFSRVKRAGFI